MAFKMKGYSALRGELISKADKNIIKQMENELQKMNDPLNSNRGKSLVNRIKKIDPEWKWGEKMPERS